MPLLPVNVAKQLPPIYTTEKVEDPIVQVKLFTPMSSFTWYLTEYDGKEEAFGLIVNGDIKELGYINIPELESIRMPLTIQVNGKLFRSRQPIPAVERDMHFSPMPLSEVRRMIKERGSC